MAEVTDLAIKAVKFYKHVVQSVEKFIDKVGMLYVMVPVYLWGNRWQHEVEDVH